MTPAKIAALLAVVRDYIVSDMPHSGHESFCKAIRGPEGENWLESEHCDCDLPMILSALDELASLGPQPRLPTEEK